MIKKPESNLQKAIIAGSSMTGYLFTFGLISYMLSKKFDNSFYLIAGLILGAVLGLYEVFRQIKK